MGRRVLAFFLGLLFGIILVVGGVAGAIAICVKVVKVEQYSPDAKNYLGDLASLSIYDIGQEIYKMFLDKKGTQDENGNYYSLKDFCDNYNIDLNTAFGIELPQEVLDIPAFEFFDEGGTERAMKQIKVSALPAILNMFGGKNEDGTSNGMFSDSAIEELSKFSMYDLLNDENIGFAGVFVNVKIADMLPDSFPAEDSDNKLMWAVGQTKIGKLLNGMSGSDSILLQLKPYGAFETLGQLALTAVLGDSQYISAILGSDAVFADLIADDGTIRMDDIINGISVGELLGCQKNQITDIENYVSIVEGDIKVMSKTDSETETTLYAMGANGEEWFEAELKCENNEEGHTHNADCFKYVWYSTAECVKEHDHKANGDMNKDGVNYARTDGLYSVLAALSITDLTSGNTDALMDEIKLIKIRDIIDAGDVNGIMNVFIDFTIEELMSGAIDDLYLGEFFSFTRSAIQNTEDYDIENAVAIYKERDNNVLAYYVAIDASGNIALSLDNKNWYNGLSECDEEHTHNENCYSYVWYKEAGVLADGVQNKLASKQIADLKYLNDEVQKMTLSDVFGDNIPSMLESIADVEIGELSQHIDRIQLGELLGYTGGLVCENTDDAHVHDYTCYEWTDKDGKAVVGMMAKLACKEVGEMSDLANTVKTFTLSDVLGDGIPSMLKSLADTEIGNLNDAINGMYLGDFLEYEKRFTCGITEDGHAHDGTCSYIWFKLQCANAEDGHEHTDECYVEVVGMMAKLADKKVSELNSLDDIVNDLTLRDVLGDNIPAMLLDVADSKISDVGTAIQDIYLGSALGYKRNEQDSTDYSKVIDGICKKTVQGAASLYLKSEDGIVWYEAVQTCKLRNNSSHTHDIDCYGYVWYEEDGTTPVSGIIKALVNSKVGNVNEKMQTVTLGEMGIGGNNILDALQDTPVTQIGDAINDLKMGIVMGFEKHYTCGVTHTHTDDCTYEWIAECTSDHSTATDHLSADHIVINGKTCYKATGLNGKIANKTVSQMTGNELTDIALGLTIGDLIDSGMISLGETSAEQDDNIYKLALMFSSGEHYITVNDKPTYACNMTGYLAFTKLSGSESDMTKKAYWLKCHGRTDESGLTAEDIAHRDAWKDITLQEFVTKLLSVI